MVDYFNILMSYFNDLPVKATLNTAHMDGCIFHKVDYLRNLPSDSCDPCCMYIANTSELSKCPQPKNACVIEDIPLEMGGLPKCSLLFERETDPSLIYDRLKRYIDDCYNFLNSMQKLNELSLDSSTVDDFASVYAHAVNDFLIIADSSLKVVWSNAEVQSNALAEPVWEDYMAHGYVPDLAELEAIQKRTPFFSHNFICGYYYHAKGFSYPSALFTLSDGLNFLGMIAITGKRAPLGCWSFEIAKQLVQKLYDHIKLSNISELQHSRDPAFQHIFMPILEEKNVNWSSFQSMANDLGFATDGYFRLVVADFESCGNLKCSLYTIRSYMEDILHTKYSLCYRGRVVFVCRFATEKDAYAMDFDFLDQWLSQYKLYAAISRVFNDIKDTAHHYKKTASLLALRFSMRKPRYALTADSSGTYAIISNLLKHDRIEDRLHSKIKTLIHFDQKNKTSYCETLFYYLKNAMRPVETSREMHVHRNTVDFRIKKCTEIAEINWSDGDELFHLYLSLFTWDYYKYINGLD